MTDAARCTITARCTICNSEFTQDQLHAAAAQSIQGCPQCGTLSLPCAPADDVTIKVNWHELRVLGMWAENYARSIKDGDPGAPLTVQAILSRLEKQFPGKAPLSFRGEIGALRETYPAARAVDMNGDEIVPPVKKGSA